MQGTEHYAGQACYNSNDSFSTLHRCHLYLGKNSCAVMEAMKLNMLSTVSCFAKYFRPITTDNGMT